MQKYEKYYINLHFNFYSMEDVFLGLGSNMGDRETHLLNAIKQINRSIGVVKKRSSVIETKSWGFSSAPFLNQVILISTDLTPQNLMLELQQIELKMGRRSKTDHHVDHVVYVDRPIDIDILIFGMQNIENELLTIPHPRMFERDFVMIPLKEIIDEKLLLKIQKL